MTEINIVLNLINHTAVLMVIAYILTRTQFYANIINKKFTFYNRFALIFIFGILSVYGTVSGVSVSGVVANVRDLGPAIAGLIAGPIVGVGAGLIGSIHRYFLGGPTVVPCSLATLLSGLFGGIIYLIRKGKFIGILGAVIFSFLFELFHMFLVIIINGHTEESLTIVKSCVIPMTTANAIGMAIFMLFSLNLIKERKIEAAKERIESELKVAHDIQMDFIPKIFPPFPQRTEFDIYATVEPAKEVGGDFYDFFFIDEDHLYFIIADVSGKGVPAALFMAVTKTLLKAKARVGLSPHEILYEVNNELCDKNDAAMFVTSFCAILDIKSSKVKYSNGGHNLPYFISREGEIKQLENTPGIALGIMENAEFESREFTVEKGDTFFLYTDGVNEAMDYKGNLFSYERLERFLEKSKSLLPKEMTSGILNKIEKFTEGAIQSDDITVLILKYYG